MGMVKQFEVCWVSPDPTRGSEIKKTRPCVVVSPNEMNECLKTIIVAPLTTVHRDFATRINVMVKRKKSQIVLDQLRTIDKVRLGARIATLNERDSEKVKSVLSICFLEKAGNHEIAFFT